MTNSILPIKTGGNPSFPLSPEPHLSRIEDNITTNNDFLSKPKNYQSVAFIPGFPLQASELNEIQENFQLQMTLTIAMMNNWITSGAGPMWRNPNQAKPGDGGDFTGTSPYTRNTGIGVGGQNDIDGGHVQKYAISGPGWRGATPLHPFVNPYSGHQNAHDKQVEVEYLAQSNDIKITFNPGWWCLELPSINPYETDDNKFRFISGLKHWIYLDEPLDTGAINLEAGGNLHDVEIPVGFVMQTGYNHCCDNDDDPLHPCDPDLADNSAGFFNDVGCGASRYFVNAIGADTVSNINWPNGDDEDFGIDGQKEYNKLSLVCTFNPKQKTVRYMNNIILYTW